MPSRKNDQLHANLAGDPATRPESISTLISRMGTLCSHGREALALAFTEKEAHVPCDEAEAWPREGARRPEAGRRRPPRGKPRAGREHRRSRARGEGSCPIPAATGGGGGVDGCGSLLHDLVAWFQNAADADIRAVLQARAPSSCGLRRHAGSMGAASIDGAPEEAEGSWQLKSGSDVRPRGHRALRTSGRSPAPRSGGPPARPSGRGTSVVSPSSVSPAQRGTLAERAPGRRYENPSGRASRASRTSTSPTRFRDRARRVSASLRYAARARAPRRLAFGRRRGAFQLCAQRGGEPSFVREPARASLLARAEKHPDQGVATRSGLGGGEARPGKRPRYSASRVRRSALGDHHALHYPHELQAEAGDEISRSPNCPRTFWRWQRCVSGSLTRRSSAGPALHRPGGRARALLAPLPTIVESSGCFATVRDGRGRNGARHRLRDGRFGDVRPLRRGDHG